MRIKILKIKYGFEHLRFTVWRWNWDRKDRKIRKKLDTSLAKQNRILAKLEAIKITE